MPAKDVRKDRWAPHRIVSENSKSTCDLWRSVRLEKTRSGPSHARELASPRKRLAQPGSFALLVFLSACLAAWICIRKPKKFERDTGRLGVVCAFLLARAQKKRLVGRGFSEGRERHGLKGVELAAEQFKGASRSPRRKTFRRRCPCRMTRRRRPP